MTTAKLKRTVDSNAIVAHIEYTTHNGNWYEFTTSYPDYNAMLLHMRTLERAGCNNISVLGAEVGGFEVSYNRGFGSRRALHSAWAG